jgi:resolvase domain protein
LIQQNYLLLIPPLIKRGGLEIKLNNRKMIYGYIRVSTDKQTVENQRYEITEFCKKQEFIVDRWITDEGISGTKDPSQRDLGKLLKKAKRGDVIICSELSRLGRTLLMVMGILNYCMQQDIQIWTIKENYRLGNDISSKVLAFAFGLSAEIERNLISQRTKEALARKKAEGVILGRPKGSKSAKTKLTGQENRIKELVNKQVSYSAIGRILGVHRLTVSSFVKERLNKI